MVTSDVGVVLDSAADVEWFLLKTFAEGELGVPFGFGRAGMIEGGVTVDKLSKGCGSGSKSSVDLLGAESVVW